MKNLNETYEKCLAILDSMGIEVGTITDLKTNSRFSSTLGRCHRTRDYWGDFTYKIEINPVLLNDGVTQKQLENTMIHELLHTVDGCFSHTGKWLQLARRVNREYGYQIQRQTECELAAKRRDERNPVKYIVACKKCNVEWKYKRWGKVCENLNRCHCPYCHSGLYMKWHDPKIQVLGLNPTF